MWLCFLYIVLICFMDEAQQVSFFVFRLSSGLRRPYGKFMPSVRSSI
jgi:hypothetical protein